MAFATAATVSPLSSSNLANSSYIHTSDRNLNFSVDKYRLLSYNVFVWYRILNRTEQNTGIWQLNSASPLYRMLYKKATATPSREGGQMYAKYAKLRDALGMTDAKVAEQAGIIPTVLSEWKRRAETNPDTELSFGNMLKVAKVLKCDLDELAGK